MVAARMDGSAAEEAGGLGRAGLLHPTAEARGGPDRAGGSTPEETWVPARQGCSAPEEAGGPDTVVSFQSGRRVSAGALPVHSGGDA